MKKRIVVLIALIVFQSVVHASNEFSDVGQYYWANDVIKEMVNENIINGMEVKLYHLKKMVMEVI